MTTNFLKTIAAFTILTLFASATFAAPALDGRTYTGDLKMGDDAKGDPDTFIFKAGTFRSTACDEYGYESAPYTATEKDGVTTFHSQTKNKSGATMNWEGKIVKEKVSGTAVMKTASGEATNATFSGELTH